MSEIYDVIVLGLGAMGAACTYHLAKAGFKVLGIEQHTLAHDKGSSHGETRMIREAYFEHPNYVPLVRRSFELWRELEQHSQQELLHRSGVLIAGPERGAILSGVRRSAKLHDIAIEEMNATEAAARFPYFAFAKDHKVIFEPGGGVLRPELCIKAHLKLATALGAKILEHTKVLEWTQSHDTVQIKTATQNFAASKLVVTAGPWTSTILSELGLALKVYKMMQLWFAPKDAHPSCYAMPAFGFELEDGFYYGLPQVSDWGIKIGLHQPRERIESPDLISRELTPQHLDPVKNFATHHLPALSQNLNRHSSCMYTMTPDEHFIIDQHPRHNRVSFAAGFSGHGFKFAPVVAEILTSIVCTGQYPSEAAFLRLK